MNKENKQMAKERRAREREMERRRAKGKVIIPVVLVVILAAAAMVWALVPGLPGKGKNASGTQENAAAGGAAGESEKSVAAGGSAGESEESAAVGSTAGESQESVEAGQEIRSDGTQAGESAQTEGDPSKAAFARFDASSLKGSYDISGDDLVYVRIKVKDYGTLTAALDRTIAPVSVDNFVSLAQDGFYDSLTFHRIIDGFMIQGGDPNGNGTGGSSKNIKGEFSANNVDNPITHVRGAVSMARSQDPDSGSSQFFIVQSDSLYLDGQYAGFGYVTEGMDIVDRICKDAKPTDGNGSIAASDQPVIESVTVIE